MAGNARHQPSGKLHSRDRRKERRASSWARGKERARARAVKQYERMEANKELRAQGKLTPWEQACAIRSEKRHPLQEAYRLKVHRERSRI